jgi:large subunit ribosomal protein L21
MTYAIIRVGGKQYRVSEGQRLLVDHLKLDPGATFSPDVLFVGGNGDADSATVTAQVVGHSLGPKVRIGKYKKRTGYRRHTGFRAKLSEIEIQSIGAAGSRSSKAPAKSKPKAEAAPEAEAAASAPSGLPQGYEELTVAAISDGVKGWSRPELEAALEYEREHANRKGAVSALESALSKEED